MIGMNDNRGMGLRPRRSILRHCQLATERQRKQPTY
jgi:hypothetical protein